MAVVMDIKEWHRDNLYASDDFFYREGDIVHIRDDVEGRRKAYAGQRAIVTSIDHPIPFARDIVVYHLDIDYGQLPWIKEELDPIELVERE